MSLDQNEVIITRIVKNLSDVLGKLGGIHSALLISFGFFFCKFSLITYKVDAINEFFKIKTSDTKLIDKNKKIQLSFCDKFHLITKCFANKKLVRLMSKGEWRLYNELDMHRITFELSKLK